MIIHIAGNDVTIGERYRQRCAWCGAVIFDMDLSRVAVQIPEGWEQMTPEEQAAHMKPGAWPVGALIAMDGAVTHVVEHEDDTPVPPECCAQIDHDVTA